MFVIIFVVHHFVPLFYIKYLISHPPLTSKYKQALLLTSSFKSVFSNRPCFICHMVSRSIFFQQVSVRLSCVGPVLQNLILLLTRVLLKNLTMRFITTIRLVREYHYIIRKPLLLPLLPYFLYVQQNLLKSIGGQNSSVNCCSIQSAATKVLFP